MRECFETAIRAVTDDCSLCQYSELCCRKESEPDEFFFSWHDEEREDDNNGELSGGS